MSMKCRSIIFIYFFLFLSIVLGVFITSDLFIDHLNAPKYYSIVISTTVMLIASLVLKDGLTNLHRALQSNILFMGITVICFLSSLFGCFQFYGLIPSNHSAFPITGSFENPAGFAAVQSSLFPFVFVDCLNKGGGRFKHLIIILTSLFCIITIVLSGSRAGMLAICSCIMVVLAFQDKVKDLFQKNRWLWMPFLALVSLMLLLLYFFKQDSADGRLFIWKRCLELIKEKPLFGYGIDGFHRLYMEHQADYFSAHPDSPYTMIADNVRNPLNEYIKLTVCFGIVGLSIAIGFMVYVIYKLLRLDKRTKVLGLSFISSMFIMSLFSYPYIYSVVWLLSFVAIIPAFVSSGNNRRAPKLLRYAILPVLLAFLSFSLKEMYYEMKWAEVIKRSNAGKAKRMIPNYEDLKRVMGDNPVFNYNYAVLLNGIGHYEESLERISKCEEKWNEYYVQLLFASIYENMGQYEKAIQAYEEAHNMVPCRFEPLFGKLMIFCSNKDTINVIQTADEIIEKPIKVHSERLSQMITHANKAKELFSD